MPRRTFSSRWAQGGAQVDPGTVKTELGWIQEAPAHEVENWRAARVDDMLAHYEEQAVPDWVSTTAYLAGALAMGSDRVVYRAVQANTGNDPTLDAGTNWAEYVPAATTGVAGVVELATDAETISGAAADRAVTPASLSARTASATSSGVVELATDSETQGLADATRAVTPAGLASLVASTAQRGILRLADAAQAKAGLDGTRAVTPLALATAGASLTARGHYTFPGGFVVQWDTQTGAFGNVGIVFPLSIPFPTVFAAVAVAGGPGSGGGSINAQAGATVESLSSVRLYSGPTTGTVQTVTYIAVGW